MIHPEYVCGRDSFDRNVDGWVTHYLVASGPAARYPGQRQAQCENEQLVRGIPLDSALVHALQQAGALIGKDFDLACLA